MLLFCSICMALGVVFFLSLLRGREGIIPFTSSSFFRLILSGRFARMSGSCSGGSAEISGSCSEAPVRHLVIDSVISLKRTRSGSIVQDSSPCLMSEPMSSLSETFCEKGRSPELASTREAPFSLVAIIVCLCHIPSFEEPSGPL